MDLESQCRREVEELHAFFALWFSGALPSTDETLSRFADVMAPAFQMISPDGARRERDEIVALVRGGHGSGETRIWIEHHAHRVTAGDTALVTYEEWQTRGGTTRGRSSSAWFEATDGAPNGVRWVHVHETWLRE